MAKISIEHSTQLDAGLALSKMKDFFNQDADLKKMAPGIHCEFNDSQMTGDIKSSQFKASISVKQNGGGSMIHVSIDLPFLLTPLKGKIEDTVKRKLAKYLA